MSLPSGISLNRPSSIASIGSIISEESDNSGSKLENVTSRLTKKTRSNSPRASNENVKGLLNKVMTFSTDEEDDMFEPARLKDKLYKILQTASLNDKHPSTQGLALNALGTMLFCDTKESNHKRKFSSIPYFTDCLAVILSLTRSEDSSIYKMGLNTLNLFAHQLSDEIHCKNQKYNENDLNNTDDSINDENSETPDLLVMIILDDLTDSVAELICNDEIDSSIREKKITSFLFCAVNFIMSVPPSDFKFSNILSKLLYVLDVAMRNKNEEFPITTLFQPLVVDGFSRQEITTILQSVHSLVTGKRGFIPDSGLKKKFRSVSAETQMAAKSVFYHILNHFSNFPSFAGVTRMTSRVIEMTDPEEPDELDSAVLENKDVQFFLYNDCTVVSLVERPKGQTLKSIDSDGENPNTINGQAQLFLRNMMGKFTWDCNVIYTNENNKQVVSEPEDTVQLNNSIHINENENYLSSMTEQSADSSKPQKRRWNKVPTYQNFESDKFVDLVDSLLVYIGDTSSECLQSQFRLNVPAKTPANMSVTEKLSRETLHKQHFLEREYLKECEKKPQLTQVFDQVKPAAPYVPTSGFLFSRLLLSQLGFLSWENRRHFHLLEKNEALLRRIKQLDRSGSREYHKIGVMYIAPGQENESVILSNPVGSQLYEDFLAAIGWEVDLFTHTGFTGLLEAETNGKSTVYYATSAMEVIFHVATRMPNDGNLSLTKKKRHIHNDRVQIIWTEHWRDYRTEIMKTDFKDAIIIIRPLRNGLYVINIIKSDAVPHFGPLQNNTIVPKIALASLVRATAINASRAVMSNVDGFQNYYQQRYTLLNEIIEKHRSAQTFEDFMSTVVKPNS